MDIPLRVEGSGIICMPCCMSSDNNNTDRDSAKM